MLNLESRIEALGSTEAEFSHHKLIFSSSRKEGKKKSPSGQFKQVHLPAIIQGPILMPAAEDSSSPWLCSQPSTEQRYIRLGWHQRRTKSKKIKEKKEHLKEPNVGAAGFLHGMRMANTTLLLPRPGSRGAPAHRDLWLLLFTEPQTGLG